MERHLDASLSPSERARSLLSLMTLQEKIGQLCKLDGFRSYVRAGETISLTEDFKRKFEDLPIGTMYGLLRADWWSGKTWGTGLEPRLMAKAVDLFQKHVLESSRLHVPLMIAEEAPHGLMALGCAVFPTGLGMGSTWNPELMRKAAGIVGAEGAAAGVHTVYGPILDLARDPRWSRVEEDFSEDPFLCSAMGVAYVEGLQGGSFPSEGGLFATLKHLGGHGDPEGGHNAAPSHVGPIELRNIQLKPFEACVKAGARSLMCAYNMIDGVPCAGSKRLLTGFLRDELGFDGFVVSDRGAIPNLFHQRFAADRAEACAKALKAGVDADEGCIDFQSAGLREALERGLIEMADIDRAVERILRLKFRLGLFENPFRKRGSALEVVGSKDGVALALEAARQSLVLLSNKDGALPLKGAKRIAVIGPNADAPMNQLGDYTAPQRRENVKTVLDGMKSLAPGRGVEIAFAKGCKVRSLRRDMLDEALAAAKSSDAVVLVLGGSSAAESDSGFLENGASRIKEVKEDSEFDKESGEGYDRAKLRLGGLQLELFRKLKALGKPLICVLVMGRPLVIDEIVEGSSAVLLAWYPGMQGGLAIAEALFGEFNPGGKLPVSFPKDEAQLPVYYNSSSPRADYIDLSGKASFPFGFGLSYSKFEISDLKLSKNSISSQESVVVSAKVRNAGELAGDEVVQLYLTDKAASVARPWRELRGFKRVHLKPGETRTVELSLGPAELGLHDESLNFAVEPGAFVVAVGSGLDSLLETELLVKGKA